MKPLLFWMCLLLAGSLAGAQELTLEQAVQLAVEHYPLLKQKALSTQTGQLSVASLGRGYLPQFNLNAQATYQSEVISLPVEVPGLPFNPPSKDQYRATGEISQLLYDGGAIRRQQQVQSATTRVEELKTDVEAQQLRERIHGLYLGILLLEEQLTQADLVAKDLQAGLLKVQAQVQNGTALRSNADVLNAELLRNDQRKAELKSLRRSNLEVLGLLINQELGETTVLRKPVIDPGFSLQSPRIQRSELTLYAYQDTLLQAQTRTLRARNQPRISVFLQGGYGRPGLNQLKNEFDWFYTGGIRLNWSLSTLYSSGLERQMLQNNRKRTGLQRETFLLNTRAALRQQAGEIDKIGEQLQLDDQLVAIRERVKRAADAQLSNGVITANDYLREVAAEDQARQNRLIHQLQLLQAQLNYATTLGQ